LIGLRRLAGCDNGLPVSQHECSCPGADEGLGATGRQNTGTFAPQITGLRGTPDQLATLAKRYRVSYSVTPAQDGRPYEVTHGAAVYVFNRAGDIKLIFTTLSQPDQKLAPALADLRAMVNGAGGDSWWQRMLSML